MKRVLVPFAAMYAGVALAQGAPVVVPNTGEATYRYEFPLPSARGIFQPSLALVYSSNGGPSSFGLGWSLSLPHIEQASRRPDDLWLVAGTVRRRLVLKSSDTASVVYRVDVATPFLELRQYNSDLTTWYGVDISGNSYGFLSYAAYQETPRRWYLRSASDSSGAVTWFTHSVEPNSCGATTTTCSQSALLSGICYNEYTDKYGTSHCDASVALTYEPNPRPFTQAISGAIVDHATRLASVTITNKGSTKSFRLTYGSDSQSQQSVLTAITQVGDDRASSLPPIVFGYGPTADATQGYRLANGQVVSVPWADASNAAWTDLDGDGRPDLVLGGGGAGIYWYRNVTVPGSTVLQFAAKQLVPNSQEFPGVVSFSNPGGEAEGTCRISRVTGDPICTLNIIGRLFDVDGDRVPDLVYASPSCPSTQLVVRLGNSSNGSVSFGAPVCMTTPLGNASIKWNGTGTFSSDLTDVDGDGIVDYVKNSSGYNVAFGTRASSTALQFGTLAPTAFYLPDLALADLNGDSLADVLRNVWTVYINDGWGFPTAVAHDRTWSLVDGQTPLPYPLSAGRQYGLLADLNGDGLAEYIYRPSGTSLVVSWGNGQGFNLAGRLTVPAPLRAGPSGLPADLYPKSTHDAGAADNGMFIDADGDGVLDYVLVDYASQTLGYYRGQTSMDGGRTILLRSVTTTLGATYNLHYSSYPIFGSDFGADVRPVVTQMKVSGVAIAPNTVCYWYSGPIRDRDWGDVHRWEYRGFQETWEQDTTTGIVKHVRWETATHAVEGMPSLVEWGVPNGGQGTGGWPTSSVFSSIQYTNSLRLNGGTCVGASAQVAPTDYPLVRFATSIVRTSIVDTVALASKATIACADVSEYGTVAKTTVFPSYDPTLADGSQQGARIEGAVFDGTAGCKTCPVETYVTDQAGNRLSRSIYLYDRLKTPTGSGSMTSGPLPQGSVGMGLRSRVRKLASATGQPETYEDGPLTTYNYDDTQNCGATVDSVVTGTVTESYEYDQTQTLSKKVVSDSSTPNVLVTETYYDRDRVSLVKGPYLATVSTTTTPPTYTPVTPVPQRAFAYDTFGRVRLESRVPISSGVVTQPIAAYQYLDQQLPVAVKTHTFAAPISYTDGAIPATSDVKVNIAYLDGLGRTIQRRERLGGTGTGDPNANIAQNLSGYRVSGAVVYDGAGRVQAKIEPFYSSTDAFVDYRTSLETTPATLHASLKAYDAQGRITCSVYAVVSGALPASVPCTSTLAENSGYKLATAYSYAGVVDGGRNLLSVTTVAPEQMATIPYGRGARTLYAAGGKVVATLDAFGNRVATSYDLLGRVTQVSRLSTDPTQPSHGFTLGYDAKGRVISRTERDAGTRTMSYTPQDQLASVLLPTRTLANGAQANDQLAYTYGAFARLYSLDSKEWQVDATGLATLVPRRVAWFSYDVPYASGSYGYTAGRMAAAGNDLTTIAFGYDQDGNQTVRDQWFPRLSGPFRSSRGVGNDGRLLSQGFSSSYSQALSWLVQYDSAGRPIALTNDTGMTSYWSAPSTSSTGAYDALGRVGTVKSDNGLTTTQRDYGTYSGALTSHSVIAETNLLYGAQQITYLGGKLASFNDQVSQTSYSYRYDENGRLVQSTATPSATTSVSQSFDEIYGFSTDKSFTPGASFGNLERVLDQRSSTDETYAYPAGSDQVTSISKTTPVVSNTSTYDYDGAGRLIRKNGTGEAFAYDTQDHLVSIVKQGVTVETLAYGPFGELVSRQVGSSTLYYVGGHATVTVNGATVAVDAHIGLAGKRIVSVSAARTMYYYRDRQGSVIATALAGALPGTLYRYTPYGALDKADVRAPGSESELGYTGALKLSGGLIYLKARVYDPAVRRFLQADAVDPRRYTYAGGDPINLVDPTGTRPTVEGQRIYVSLDMMVNYAVLQMIGLDQELAALGATPSGDPFSNQAASPGADQGLSGTLLAQAEPDSSGEQVASDASDPPPVGSPGYDRWCVDSPNECLSMSPEQLVNTGSPQRGTLKVGMPADFSGPTYQWSEVFERSFVFAFTTNVEVVGKFHLRFLTGFAIGSEYAKAIGGTTWLGGVVRTALEIEDIYDIVALTDEVALAARTSLLKYPQVVAAFTFGVTVGSAIYAAEEANTALYGPPYIVP